MGFLDPADEDRALRLALRNARAEVARLTLALEWLRRTGSASSVREALEQADKGAPGIAS